MIKCSFAAAAEAATAAAAAAAAVFDGFPRPVAATEAAAEEAEAASKDEEEARKEGSSMEAAGNGEEGDDDEQRGPGPVVPVTSCTGAAAALAVFDGRFAEEEDGEERDAARCWTVRVSSSRASGVAPGRMKLWSRSIANAGCKAA
mmetsp:Transcript_11644/g.25172  ORF Transcript_11644/g.25172 Transcript_11644/m.25172 type:complete len:146 (+) Transcript_11644:906-1343(+)